MNEYKEIAKRVFDLMDPWERDDIDGPEEMEILIKQDPIETIKFLLDRIEEEN